MQVHWRNDEIFSNISQTVFAIITFSSHRNVIQISSQVTFSPNTSGTDFGGSNLETPLPSHVQYKLASHTSACKSRLAASYLCNVELKPDEMDFEAENKEVDVVFDGHRRTVLLARITGWFPLGLTTLKHKSSSGDFAWEAIHFYANNCTRVPEKLWSTIQSIASIIEEQNICKMLCTSPLNQGLAGRQVTIWANAEEGVDSQALRDRNGDFIVWWTPPTAWYQSCQVELGVNPWCGVLCCIYLH